MATLQNTIDFARTLSQEDSNGLTDAKGIVFANEALTDFRRRLVDKGVDAATIQEAYRDGTAEVGTYLYPTSPALLLLKAIELNYTDTNDEHYQTATQVDVSNLPDSTSFSWLRENASQTFPQFDDHGDWFEIFPTPVSTDNLTRLIRIIYFAQPTEYSALSDTISYPESQDYRVLGWRIASNYFYSLGDIPRGDALNLKYEERVEQFVRTLGRGTQQPLNSTPIQWDGWDF